MYIRLANGLEEERNRKGVDNSEPVPKRQCHEDKLLKEILAGDETTDEHTTFAIALSTAISKPWWPAVNTSCALSTLLAQKNLFSPVLADIDCIQIQHTGQFHWVTLSAAVNDTMCMTQFSGAPLSSSLQVQLALIYKAK